MKFGIIGTNWITDSFIQAGNNIDDFELSAVYSRTEEKAKNFASKYGITNTFTDLESLAKSDIIDGVYIASPNLYHFDQIKLFLENGKAVFCEKPITSNSKEFKQLIEIAKNNNVLLMEGMKNLFLPNYVHVKNKIDSVGTIRKAHFSYCQYSSRYDKFKNGIIENAFNPKLSNGALMDLGIYPISIALDLFGKPNSIKSSGIILENSIDGEGSIIFDYIDKTVVIDYSKITNSIIQNEIQGESGNILIKGISTFDSVEIVHKDGEKIFINEHESNNEMEYEIKHFIEMYNKNKIESDINTFDKILLKMETLDEIRKQLGIIYIAD